MNDIEELIEEAYKAGLAPLIRKTYDFKKEHNPGMQSWDSWLREVWAEQTLRSCSPETGRFTVAEALKAAKIEYFGEKSFADALPEVPEDMMYAYCEEGIVTATVVAVSLDRAKDFRARMLEAGYGDAEIVEDYDEGEFPVTGTKPFAEAKEISAK